MNVLDWFNRHTHVTPEPVPPIPWFLWEPSAVDRLAGLVNRELQERIDRYDRFDGYNVEGTRTGRLSCAEPHFSNMPKARP